MKLLLILQLVIIVYFCYNQSRGEFKQVLGNKRNLDITRNGIIIFLIIIFTYILIVIALIFSWKKNIIDYEVCKNVSLILNSFLLASGIIIWFNFKWKIKKLTLKSLASKYGIVEKLRKPENVIIEGDKTEIGHIRKKYLFSYKVNKFNCIFSNYYYEKLCAYHRNRAYYYIKTNNFIEYCYDLECLGIKPGIGILSEPIVVKNLEKLYKTKVISIRIDGNFLIVQKETILNNYNSNDITIDVADIELFYNQIVEEILGEIEYES